MNTDGFCYIVIATRFYGHCFVELKVICCLCNNDNILVEMTYLTCGLV